jgi:polar amino acid transport system substrate-binding protein
MLTMKLRHVLRWIALPFLGLFLALPAHAQPAQPELKVGTRVLPPMVVQRDGALTGFSIDLWNAIGNKLGFKTSYQIAPDVRALLELIRSGQVEAGISAISITAARETEFDFSQPMMSAGLQIMVRGKSKDAGDANPLADLAALIFSKSFLIWIGIAMAMVLIPAHIVWLLERNHPSGLLTHRGYFPGIFDAIYWASTTLATQGVIGCRALSRFCGCSPALCLLHSTRRNCQPP